MPYWPFCLFFPPAGGWCVEEIACYFSVKYLVSVWNKWIGVCLSIWGFWAIFILISKNQTEPENSTVSLLNIQNKKLPVENKHGKWREEGIK